MFDATASFIKAPRLGASAWLKETDLPFIKRIVLYISLNSCDKIFLLKFSHFL